MRATSATGKTPSGSSLGGGFTLIELLVVIAVLVLLSSALPLALDRTVPGRRVTVTAQKLVGAVRDASSQSVLAGRSVSLEMHEQGLSDGARISVPFPSATRVTLADADGRPLRRLTVYPDGSADGANFVVSERGHLRTVAVSSLTGRVTLEAMRNAQ
jgi:general secretion pathway protein H